MNTTPRAAPQIERDPDWERIEAQREQERLEREEARQSWTPEAVVQIEKQLEQVFGEGWAERARAKRAARERARRARAAA